MSRNTFEEYLKAASGERHRSRLSPAALLRLHHQSYLLCQPLLLIACDSGERRLCVGDALPPASSFVCFFLFFTLRQWTDVQLRFVDIEKNRKSMSICVSKKWKIKCRNFLPLRKTSSSAMCFDTSVKTRRTAQRRGPLSSRVPQIINLNLSKQSLSSGPASPSSLCCSYALPLVFLREQRVELNHYFLKEIITSDQWSDALPAP